MGVVGRILRDQQRERLTRKYASKDRYIPKALYHELKSRRKCMECGKNHRGLLEIHHTIPVSEGGENNRENLMAVCHACHERLDGGGT